MAVFLREYGTEFAYMTAALLLLAALLYKLKIS